jgi:hypothetical protein
VYDLKPQTILNALIAIFILSAAPALASEHVTFVDASGSSGVTVTYFNGTSIVSEATSAGQYNFTDGVGNVFNAFCTDPFDSIYNGESWDVTRVLTTSPEGFSSITYPVGPNNISALDYIGQHYSANGSQPAAQVAVWDLVVGGHVSYDAGTNTYTYDASKFSADAGVSIKDVYEIEQLALKSHTSQKSYLLKQIDGTHPSNYGRPQDLLTYNPIFGHSVVPPVPEPSAPQMAFCLALAFGVVQFFTRRRNRHAGA